VFGPLMVISAGGAPAAEPGDHAARLSPRTDADANELIRSVSTAPPAARPLRRRRRRHGRAGHRRTRRRIRFGARLRATRAPSAICSCTSYGEQTSAPIRPSSQDGDTGQHCLINTRPDMESTVRRPISGGRIIPDGHGFSFSCAGWAA